VEEGEPVGADHLVDVHIELSDEVEAEAHILRVLPGPFGPLAQLDQELSVSSLADATQGGLELGPLKEKTIVSCY
jgi:hypothetical protein